MDEEQLNMFVERILVLSPHTDDAELGAGGLIHLLARNARQVSIVHFSDTANINGEEVGLSLRGEALASARCLGLTKKNLIFANYPTRFFSSQRQEILDFMIELKKNFTPDLVLCPGPGDKHQDHAVIGAEAIRAFSAQTILGFDTYWNQSLQNPTAVVELSRSDVEAKIEALKEYRSQQGKGYMDPNTIFGQARMRGVGPGFEFAEAFQPLQVRVPLQVGLKA